MIAAQYKEVSLSLGLDRKRSGPFSCYQIKKNVMRMVDEKAKRATDTTGTGTGPAPVQFEADGGTPTPKQVPSVQPEKGADTPKEQSRKPPTYLSLTFLDYG